MRKILLIFVISVSAAFAAPRKNVADRATGPDKTAVRRKTSRPWAFLKRIGRAEPDFALRLSSLGIKPESH